MVIEVDLFKVRLRFTRLYADPAIFDDQPNTVKRYLSTIRPRIEQTAIYQITGEISPIDDSGKTPTVAGTARYLHGRRVVRSEYLENAMLTLEYMDFGSGLSVEDHSKLWHHQKWVGMNFKLEEFSHDHYKIEIPDITELYETIRPKADPSALVDVELPDLPEKLFRVFVRYLENQLKHLAEKQQQTIDIYVARDLLDEEKRALEKRLTRPSTTSTIFILLSKVGHAPTI
jgi:hypothetical protein